MNGDIELAGESRSVKRLKQSALTKIRYIQECKAVQSICLWFQNLSDAAPRQIRHSLKVAAFCFGSAYLSSYGAGKVAEQ